MPAATSQDKPAPVVVDPLHIHLLAGPNKGVRTVHHQPVVTFGRESDNDVVIEENFVSRQHGEFRYEGGKWFLVNRSPNGTVVGKRTIKDKSRPLNDGEQIFVGPAPILRVHIAERAGVTAPLPTTDFEERPTGEISEEEGKAKLGGRRKLWLIIGGWWVVLLLGVVFYATLDRGGGVKKAELPPALTREQIELVLHKPLEDVRPDELQAKEMLRDANELYPRSKVSRKALYKAYDTYKSALAFSGKSSFGGYEDLQYEDTRKRLGDAIWETYNAGYTSLRAGGYEDALARFNDILNFYTDTGSAIYKNIEALKRAAVGNAKRK